MEIQGCERFCESRLRDCCATANGETRCTFLWEDLPPGIAISWRLYPCRMRMRERHNRRKEFVPFQGDLVVFHLHHKVREEQERRGLVVLKARAGRLLP